MPTFAANARSILLVGATGLVGVHVLQALLADARVGRVIAPTRRPLPAHAKLLNPQVDFDALPEMAPWWAVDAVISTLGTTIGTAGTREAFRRVDHAYPLRVAELARRNGASAYVLNSAKGADPRSRIFYGRVKGDLERDLATLDFPSLTFVRPGLIGGERGEFRLGERIAAVVLGIAGPLLPRSWRINPADVIAAALVEAAVQAAPGVHVVPAEHLTGAPVR